jgi:hypothetical protein
MAKLTDVFDDSVSDIVQTLVTSGYSRDAELAADALGASSWPRPATIRRRSRLLARMQGEGGMFATHPAPEERIEALGAPLAVRGRGATRGATSATPRLRALARAPLEPWLEPRAVRRRLAC